MIRAHLRWTLSDKRPPTVDHGSAVFASGSAPSAPTFRKTPHRYDQDDCLPGRNRHGPCAAPKAELVEGLEKHLRRTQGTHRSASRKDVYYVRLFLEYVAEGEARGEARGRAELLLRLLRSRGRVTPGGG